MSRKTAIVTGSSSGFGFLCVIELALKGFTVIATMRDTNKAKALLDLAKEKELDNDIHVTSLDVTSSDSIHDFKKYLDNYSQIDVLINNAGFAVGGFSEELSIEDYRRQFETNFFGVIAVTNAVLPIMRASKQGRIINMSSISGRFGFPGLSAYTASKHALEGYSESLRLELRPFGIDVSLIEPGSYQTNIWTSVDQLENNPDSPYTFYTESLLKEINNGKADYGDPSDVAKLAAQIASNPGPSDLRYPVGKGVKTNLFLKKTLPWKLIENVVLKRFKL
ncbi:SDR family oxidoreductase [Neobacillus cucumis]|uniref:SDR family oxidoreductase n=1 Tax=Neobacillus cucumis TaxID=1740721 RepID=UPI001964E216|nr:SDR family oxidoreductase [Neobacillus cucumis]MBM7655350.1 NAD(P)-dependent dehydrogenase (short-subunit alcohol dehydrogenase family) [Neobacillus cucumis]